MQKTRDEWTPERRALWEKTQSRGKTHFIWVRGAGVWGILMTIFATFIQWLAYAGMSLVTPIQPVYFLQILLINLVICPIGGSIWGLWSWTITEKSYRRATGKTDS